uniref:Uncharacterized protein n=1 Tax=Rhizophagus irregularis (strain DAOM 181602 / DAOM 197198 / MUCL 43194) TaxID=747089 RepID=U9SLF8_RHIID
MSWQTGFPCRADPITNHATCASYAFLNGLTNQPFHDLHLDRFNLISQDLLRVRE